MLTNVLGYSLALGTALAGSSAARLQNSGEFSTAGRTNGTANLLLALALVSTASTVAAVCYFSWAFLRWPHIAAFLLSGVFLTGPIAKIGSKRFVWAIFLASELVVLFAESIFILGA